MEGITIKTFAEKQTTCHYAICSLFLILIHIFGKAPP
jgi:hypothetical protein